MSRYIINHYIDALTDSASMALAEKARSMKAAGDDIINLTIGEPDFDTPDPVVQAAVKAMHAGDTHYVSGWGIPGLRKRIAQKMREENNISCDASNILVTPGAKFAIYAAVRTLLNEGDEAIILDPSWVSYESIILAAGGIPKRVKLSFSDNYTITEQKLEAACTNRSKLLIINTPNNPTGRMLTEEEADVIVAFVKRHNIIVISDEIYEKIIFDQNKHISLGSYSCIADRVLTVNGLSKCVAMTGWRLGYLVGDTELISKIYMLFQHSITCVSGFIQHAAITAFDCTAEMEQIRNIFEKRRNAFIEALKQVPCVTCNYPQGTFYAWVHIDWKSMDSYKLCDYQLTKTGVMGVPGQSYGLGGDQCIRFSFASSEEVLREAAARIFEAFREE